MTHGDQITLLLNTLVKAREELNKWGQGDFHYGSRPQDSRVVSMVKEIDGVVAQFRRT